MDIENEMRESLPGDEVSSVVTSEKLLSLMVKCAEGVAIKNKRRMKKINVTLDQTISKKLWRITAVPVDHNLSRFIFEVNFRENKIIVFYCVRRSVYFGLYNLWEVQRLLILRKPNL